MAGTRARLIVTFRDGRYQRHLLTIVRALLSTEFNAFHLSDLHGCLQIQRSTGPKSGSKDQNVLTGTAGDYPGFGLLKELALSTEHTR